ncbi:MAG TPA: mannitol dehydrogenase family protein [Alphaproteobacteria bacterium]|nr:mannitol dehydrogenase family protein [Alphaproteobacteria bacterium]
MPRLNLKTLGALGDAVQKPKYDRSEVSAGIVHLGIGAFHRAHMAVYVDSLLADDPSWGIVGASLRRPDTREALEPQDGLYTLAVRGPKGTRLRVIGSVMGVLDANTQRDELLGLMAHPDIRIVSLTVTEKGYCHDPATGELDEANPDIVHDLANPEGPRSAPGIIVEALHRRFAAGGDAFAVLSCDNLPNNGATTRRIVLRFARLRDPLLAEKIEADVVFPSTMVDRIVPATTDADRAEIAAALGIEDAWPVMTEPFTQWVIENNFPGGRPQFEAAGVEMVADVAPFETMKLRMLNGSHSSMAYLGHHAAYRLVSQLRAAPEFKALIVTMMTDEVIPTLGMDRARLEDYRDRLIRRFSNPALKHLTFQIAMDGSQKLPQRLLGTIRGRLRGSHPVDRLALGVAGWMRYVTGIDDAGNPIEVQDPMAGRLRAIADAAGRDPERLVAGLLGVAEIFGTDLIASRDFRALLTEHLRSLFDKGAAATVRELAAGGEAARLLGE